MEVVAGASYTLGIETAQGIGRYQFTLDLEGASAAVLPGDFDGDGLVDLATFDAQTGEWWVSLGGEGSRVPVLWTTWSTTPEWTDMVAGDFDGDGRDDFAGRVASSGEWWVAFSAQQSARNMFLERWSTEADWTDVVVGDFDGDGRDDLAGRVASSGEWWVTRLPGIGSHGESAYRGRWSTTAAWSDVTAGDFNGDGRDDIASRNASTGEWWVSESTGTGMSGTNRYWTRWSNTAWWRDVVSGDLNGDTLDDLAGRNAQTGEWWVALSRADQEGADNQFWGRFAVPASSALLAIDSGGDSGDSLSSIHLSTGESTVLANAAPANLMDADVMAGPAFSVAPFAWTGIEHSSVSPTMTDFAALAHPLDESDWHDEAGEHDRVEVREQPSAHHTDDWHAGEGDQAALVDADSWLPQPPAEPDYLDLVEAFFAIVSDDLAGPAAGIG